jgi:hypothetical protein
MEIVGRRDWTSAGLLSCETNFAAKAEYRPHYEDPKPVMVQLIR